MTIPTELIKVLVVGAIVLLILTNEKLRFFCAIGIVIALSIYVGTHLS